MSQFIALLCRLSVCVFRRGVLAAALGFCVITSVFADDIAISEQNLVSFLKVLESPESLVIQGRRSDSWSTTNVDDHERSTTAIACDIRATSRTRNGLMSRR
jgi:hypothetical protein